LRHYFPFNDNYEPGKLAGQPIMYVEVREVIPGRPMKSLFWTMINLTNTLGKGNMG
jgi:hypothetical protein